MDIFKIFAVGMVSLILIVFLRQQRSEIAAVLSIAAGLLIFSMIVPEIMKIFYAIDTFFVRTGIDRQFFLPLIKILGTAYITQFGAQLCTDAGETALAAKIELAGKVIILLVVAPVIWGLFETIARIVP